MEDRGAECLGTTTHRPAELYPPAARPPVSIRDAAGDPSNTAGDTRLGQSSIAPRTGVVAHGLTWHLPTTPFGSNPKETPTMAQAINRHDAQALALIDRALRDGRFTAECVAQIHRAFEAARTAEQRSAAVHSAAA